MTAVKWEELKPRRISNSDIGYANYFTERHKRKMLNLAKLRPHNVFYDLGSGDASVLIFAVKEFRLKKAVGYELNPMRRSMSRQRVNQEGLSDKITILGDMKDANLSQADVILSMHPEDEETYDLLSRGDIRNGTRIIKHDLPLLGFDYYKSDYPFYLHRFPVKRMKSPEEWASRVLEREVASVQELWHELLYYGYEKAYDKWEIRRFDRILRSQTRRGALRINHSK